MKVFCSLAFMISTFAFNTAFSADLPNPILTPGVAQTDVTVANLCPVAHTPNIRNVSAKEKAAIYNSYGLQKDHTGYCAVKGGCEIDHLISLEIGGSNDQKNLWPEPYSGTLWNAHVKDRLENWFHAQVCSKKMTLEQAQHDISTNWILAYRQSGLPLPK